MATLLLRLEGPMQSWGLSSRFTERDSAREPTKSGVIGLIAAAMGRPRNAPIADLTAMRMGVRADREGSIACDYQTAMCVPKADGSKKLETSTSHRYYLTDACFLVGLEGPRELLNQVRVALSDPKWPLFLGRKAFVPSTPIVLNEAIRDACLEEALKSCPWQGRIEDNPPALLRTLIESDAENGIERLDVPLSFETRTFTARFVRTDYYPNPGGLQ
jgi:CRISPR system Cascade subunit CasD